mgnify:CR=1 FL=1
MLGVIQDPAASHDLRQPLHALGLFAEALRARHVGDASAQLVHSINASVDALEGLFAELLDISRIDVANLSPTANMLVVLGTDKAAAQKALHDAAHKFLSNPVIEDYRLEMAD